MTKHDTRVADVFEACIADLELGAKQVILEDTRRACPAANQQYVLRTVRTVHASVGEFVSASTILSYISENLASARVPDVFPIDDRFVVLTRAEAEQYWRPDDLSGWTEFERRYPDSQRMLTMSRLGFNEDGSQALIAVGKQFVSSYGVYLCLHRVDGDWTVVHTGPAWIS